MRSLWVAGFVVSRWRQELPDELLRRDRLRFVARVSQCLEVTVFGDDVFRVGGDGAVGEDVVVRIGGDDAVMELAG